MVREIKTRILLLLAEEPKSSTELVRELGVSQPTLSRLMSQMGMAVVTLGKARATRYARPRNVRGMGSLFPVYRLDEHGDAHRLGDLRALINGKFSWEPTDEVYCLYRHLPWFIEDMRPDGFVGRAFAHRQSRELNLPDRLADWNEDHVLTALVRRGEECMGNLIIGEESLSRYFTQTKDQAPAILSPDLRREYPLFAKAAMEGDPVGSSAGGEQPKFTALIEIDGYLKQVLIKFSPSTATQEGRRWADLLVCEHIAATVIGEAGFRASQSRVLEIENRMYLEVERFDRTGRWGRRPIISLGAVDAEFFGDRDNWIAASRRLESGKMLPQSEASTLRWLSAFGWLIANVDQHFGNVSLVMRDPSRLTFELTPAYDILPMLYRPKNGEASVPTFVPPPPLAGAAAEWTGAREWAQVFWGRAAQDSRISAEFRSICLSNQALLAHASDGPRLFG